MNLAWPSRVGLKPSTEILFSGLEKCLLGWLQLNLEHSSFSYIPASEFLRRTTELTLPFTAGIFCYHQHVCLHVCICITLSPKVKTCQLIVRDKQEVTMLLLLYPILLPSLRDLQEWHSCKLLFQNTSDYAPTANFILKWLTIEYFYELPTLSGSGLKQGHGTQCTANSCDGK